MHCNLSRSAASLCVIAGSLLSAGCNNQGKATPADPAHAQSAAPASLLSLSVVAGVPSGQGYLDGQRETARFSYPQGMCFDAAGNLIVADSRNQVIRKIDPSGKVTTLAGSPGLAGSADGAAGTARFDMPFDVAADAAGNVYVADAANQTIRRIAADGTVTTLAGSPGQSGAADGKGGEARFNGPGGIAVDRQGNLYVADTWNAAIRKIAPDGTVSTLAGSAGSQGHADGQGAAARFTAPGSIAIDAAGTLYVTDADNTIRRILANGMVSTVAGVSGSAGSADGAAREAQFNNPAGIGVDAAGNLYVTDNYNATVRRIDAAGMVTTLAGTAGQSGSRDGAGRAAQFHSPARVAVDAAGNVYVTDNNSAIRRINAGGAVTTWAGAVGETGSADGPGSNARFSFPNGIAIDAQNNLYIADQDNSLVRKIAADGKVSTIAGQAGTWDIKDGTGSEARFAGVGGLAIDAGGNLYVTEFSSQTVRRITPAGVVTTLAGSAWSGGYADGKGADARFSNPNNVAVDKSGNLYVADYGNNAIRKIAPDGTVSTLAGGAGAGSADGTGSAAQFNGPNSIALDAAGNLLVTDSNNDTVRKVTLAGVVTTLAGQPGAAGSADGMGPAARFNYPWGIVVDPAGVVYVADANNNSVRRIDTAGKVDTLVGGGINYRNQLGKLPAGLAYPIGLALDATGSTLYITEPDAVLKANLK